MSEQEYRELQPGDIIQEGDEWQNEFGRWRPFLVLAGSRVQVRQSQRVRRPIGTAQETVIDSQRERIAYEELQVGDAIQPGDEWQNDNGRWQPFSVAPIQVQQGSRVRRPYKISTILEIGDALAKAQKAAAQLQSERDELRVEIQNLLKTITDNADQFADAGKILEQQRDEARAELQRVQKVVRNLYDEPTARQVQEMLRIWATELDWSAGCFDSVGRDKVSAVQRVLVAVIERIETMLNPEGGGDGE